jgi:sporulation protein YlmC with PRC-barrel domain
MSKVDVDIALGILDHQLVDSDGHHCGKVDDLEIAGLDGDSPEVVAILVGGNAWRHRGILGRLAARLSGNAVHVPWAQVDAVTSVVTLKRPAAEMRLNRGARRWGRRGGEITGSGWASGGASNMIL